MSPKDKPIEWSDEFVTGYDEIDECHKKILIEIKKLYEICLDTAKYKAEIAEVTASVEKGLIEHMDKEIYYLKKFNIEGWKEHVNSHKKLKDKLDSFKIYVMPPAVWAVLVCETVREYMVEHFFTYDIHDIPKLEKKMEQDNLDDIA